MRQDGRSYDQMRTVSISPHYIKRHDASVLIEVGDTKVICSVSVENRVPPFLKDSQQGWLTAEYGMLPCSGNTRISREAARGKISGRTAEIQRLIGRSLRSVVNMSFFPNMTLVVDCDVLQADGGTRTASITGSCVALHLAFQKLLRDKKIRKNPLKHFIAAISVGLKKDQVLLDLCYEEDSRSDVDMNFVMTETGLFVEIQGTSEEKPFAYQQFEEMASLARKGIAELSQLQKEVL